MLEVISYGFEVRFNKIQFSLVEGNVKKPIETEIVLRYSLFKGFSDSSN